MSAEIRSESAPFDRADLDQLRRHGIAEAEARRQLELLTHPPVPPVVEAPCTPDDGVEIVAAAARERLTRRWRQAASAGRLLKLVPASGAASRMFASLSRALSEIDGLGSVADDAARADLATLVERLDELPFAAQIREYTAGPQPTAEEILRALLDTGALDFGNRPKGLIPFHREGEAARTPLEEQLAEAAELVRDEAGVCRVHFTVPRGAEDSFREAARRVSAPVAWALGFSVQSPSTDTLATDPDGRLFRNGDGSLLLRPGGHGSLLGNLQRLDGDIVLLKNIDNVQPRCRRQTGLDWQRILVGRLVELQDEAHELVRRLSVGTPGARGAATTFLARSFLPRHATVPGARTRGELIDELEKPLRVCGVVRNTGEPGGGPFWVATRQGAANRQIVEAAEISSAPEQQAMLHRATHFNPVLMALAVRDAQGEPFDLARYVDPRRAFLASRQAAGRTLRALEHPGLWNGGMAHWNTLFVEVPAEAFSPVKTVFDLLRPEHRPC